MSSKQQKQEQSFSQKAIRDALKCWPELTRLGKHPLAQLNIIKSRRQKENYSDTPEGYGFALRAELREIIESFQPREAIPEIINERLGQYIILNEQYLNNRQRQSIEERYDITKPTYTRWQANALARVGNILREREEKWLASQQSTSPLVNTVVPFIVPPMPSHTLIGRDQMLLGLKKQLFASHTQNVALFALNGLPGVGKTALAITIAHDKEVQEHFSDGILWVGLGNQPDLSAHLTNWGMALGIPPSEMAKFGTIEQQAKAIHTVIGTRRMLLVIDDAWDINQALVFKLGGPNSTHLLTTRHPELAWDFAQQEARAIHELNESESLVLLSQFVPQLVIKHQQKARALVKAVDGLPLALILMGRYLQKAIHLGKADALLELLRELEKVQTRLSLTMPLSPLEKQPSLPVAVPLSLLASIEISDLTLPEAARQTWRALSVFLPKPHTFSEEAALAVSTKTLNELKLLVEAGLIEDHGNERYTMHQVIADYASLKNNHPDADHRRAASYFAKFAQKHSKKGYDQLDLDWQNISHAMLWAYANQLWQPLIDGIQGLTKANLGVMGFMDARGHWNHVSELLEKALEGAQALNDRQAEAEILSSLGAYAFRQADRATAEQLILASLSLLEQCAPSEELTLQLSHCYEFLARLEMERELEAAHEWIERGLTELEGLESEAGKYQQGYFNVLLATLNGRSGHYEEAIRAAEKGLALLPPLPTPARVSALTSLGLIFHLQDKIDQSIEYTRQGIKIAQELGDLRRLADLWINLGINEQQKANFSFAMSCYQNALHLYQKIGDFDGESQARNNLALIYIFLGEDELALKQFTIAFHLIEKYAFLENHAFAKTNQALLYIYQGELTKATLALVRAEEICLQLGLTSLLPGIWREQADIARLKKEDDNALFLVDKSIKLAHQTARSVSEGMGWSIRGKILDGMQKFAQAEIAHQTSLNLLAEQNPYDLAMSQLAFGEHYIQRDLYLSQRAKSLLSKALNTFERLGAKREMALALALLE